MSDKMGIINVLKPPGMSSFDVVNWIKKNLDIAKVGHTGTLDPRATGVLPICVGRATRVIPHLPEGLKEYIAEIKLGEITETLDAEGEIIQRSDKWKDLNESEIVSAIDKFTGDIEQVPPMYSAIKINGQRLYKLARKGEEVERPSREVSIEEIKNISVELPKIRFKVKCSKGTYIRSLARDIGQALGCGAFLSFLIRTASGPFSIDNSHTIQSLEQLAQKNNYKFIISLDKPLVYPSFKIKKTAHKKAVNGAYLDKEDFIDVSSWIQGEKILVYSNDGDFIGISEIDEDTCKPIRVFA